jgi:hypothetical protein
MSKDSKAITIEVLSQDHRRVIFRRRFVPGIKGHRWTPQGVDGVLANFCEKFDLKYPGHQYRMVDCANATFGLIWQEVPPGLLDTEHNPYKTGAIAPLTLQEA